MDSKNDALRLRNYMPLESEIYHIKFMEKAKALDDAESLYEVLDMVHATYLVHKHLFKSLARRVAEDGYQLPPLKEILSK